MQRFLGVDEHVTVLCAVVGRAGGYAQLVFFVQGRHVGGSGVSLEG